MNGFLDNFSRNPDSYWDAKKIRRQDIAILCDFAPYASLREIDS